MINLYNSSALCGFAALRETTKILALSLTLLSSNALAQEAAEEEDDIDYIPHVKKPPIIVVANGAPTYTGKIGQSVTLITGNDLIKSQASSVNDILSTTPGINVSRNGGIGGVSAVRIRGAEGDQTLTLIDGVRVNDPAAPGGAFDFGNLLVGNIERVEVLRGPNSVPWGSQAIGGVVNVVTQQPKGYFEADARAEYGSKDRAQLVGNISGKAGPILASLGGGYFTDDGISAFKNGTEADGFRHYAANGKIGVEISRAIDIDLRGYYTDSKVDIDGFPPPAFSFADTAQFSTSQQLLGYAGVNVRLFDGNFKNRVAFTINDLNRDNFASSTATTASFLARGRVERFEYQGDAEIFDSIRTVFGAEKENSRFSDGFSLSKTGMIGFYGQAIISPTYSLTLTGGARLDDHDDYGSEATFSGNVNWRPGNNTTLRASYGEGFKAPTLFQLNSFFGNVTLQPERAKSYELGIEQRLINGDLTFGATAFLRNTTNQIDFISCFGQSTGICTNRPDGTYDNVDRTRAKGFELTMTARPSDILTVDANYTYSDAKDRVTGLALVRRPKHSLNASIDWQPIEKLKLGAALQLFSDSADTDFETFSRTSLDGYALATLRASYDVSDQISLYGRVENVGDVQYETVSGYGSYGRGAHIGIRARY